MDYRFSHTEQTTRNDECDTEEPMMKLIYTTLAALALTAAGMSSASAHDNRVGFSISIGSSPGYYYAPPVVSYGPPVVYYAPPPVVYYREAPRAYYRSYGPHRYHGGHGHHRWNGHGGRHHHR